MIFQVGNSCNSFSTKHVVKGGVFQKKKKKKKKKNTSKGYCLLNGFYSTNMSSISHIMDFSLFTGQFFSTYIYTIMHYLSLYEKLSLF